VAIGRGDGAELRALIEPFVRDNTERRFGPAREVAHTQERGLVLSVSFEGLQTSNRKKSGLALTNPRIIAVRADRTPSEAAHMQDIEELLPGIRPHA
jgi:DNA ligase-1